MEELIPLPRTVSRLGGLYPAAAPVVTRVPEDASLGEEGYRLRVDGSGIRIEAAAPAGAAHAMTTLRQLRDPGGLLPGILIEDAPLFAWRGLHLDVVRHFFPAACVREAIDWCAEHKLNRFHWHLTDDQGWRLPVPSLPRLETVSAWRSSEQGAPHGGTYTAAEIREIVRYAEERHVMIVPEIEMPGHARAALAAYPELSCTGRSRPVPATWGIFEDVFCAGNDDVFRFLRIVLEETARLIPGPYLHIGGDEVPGTRWTECPRCRARMQREGLATPADLQSAFLKQVERILDGLGKTMIGWEEIAEGGAPRSAVVMSWKGSDAGIAAARAGHRVVMCPMQTCYLDSYQGPRETEPPAFPRDVPLSASYAFDPAPAGLAPEVRARILGGQACLWTEYMPGWADVRRMAFPRLAAIAERLWGGSSPDSLEGFQRRYAAHEGRLRAAGLL